MDHAERHNTALHYIIVDAISVAGEWNGDESGIAEERSNIALEIQEKALEIQKLIEELEEL